jgi:hypothetical protein
LCDRDIERVWRSKIEVEPPQKRLCCGYVRRFGLLSPCRAGRPCVKCREGDRASSGVIPPVRTRRAIAEANSAAAKSLTISAGAFDRMKASARDVSGSLVNNATSTLALR